MNEFIARHNSDGDGMLDEMYDYWVKDFDAETSKTEQGGFSGENGELIIACEGGYEPFRTSTRRETAAMMWTSCIGFAANTATHRTFSV